jgi:hypothetical protein
MFHFPHARWTAAGPFEASVDPFGCVPCNAAPGNCIIVALESRIDPEGDMAPEDIDAERSIRVGIWTQVESEGPDDLLPARVRDLGMYGGAQGIWVDKARTAELTPDEPRAIEGCWRAGCFRWAVRWAVRDLNPRPLACHHVDGPLRASLGRRAVPVPVCSPTHVSTP